jgi:tRNA G18 (ribose-2'-O)-methylase SpoU
LFIAEGRFVVKLLLAGGRFRARSLLVTPVALESLRAEIDPRLGVRGGVRTGPDVPVYVVSEALMERVAGFLVHRGCLAAAERGPGLDAAAVLGGLPPGPALAVVLEGVNNHDNIGGVFRNAGAFGASCVLLAGGCADPLYRKAVRVSMGVVLRVPFASVEADEALKVPAGVRAVRLLRSCGFRVLALTPDAGAVNIAACGDGAQRPERIALLLGAEGDGLQRATIDEADEAVRIAMAPGVDSLNVSVACAVALHRLGPREFGGAPGVHSGDGTR